MTFSGKVALITGASRGIGRAIAVDFARQGADVAILGRDTAALAQTAADVRTARAETNVHVIEADVVDPSAIEAAVAGTIAELGRLDCAVANAGQALDALLVRLKPEDIENVEVGVLPVRRRRQADDAAAFRRDRARFVDRWADGQRRASGLRGGKGRSTRFGQVRGKGIRVTERKSQRRRARLDRNRDD